MDRPKACVDRETWRRLLAGELQDPQRSELEAHLDYCESCQNVVALLAEWSSAAVMKVGESDHLEAFGPESEGPDAAAHPPSLPGFDDLVEAGRGSMGIVYRARQLGLDRQVAIKVLSTAAWSIPQARIRAARESKALARLNHPNIVRIYSVGETDGIPYIVMEWLEGGDLGDRLQSAPLPPREAASLAQTIALAVAAAHKQGVIHRDLKPRNILLGSDGIPRLTDFGLALDHDSNERLTLTGYALGTPRYMAPEQIESNLGQVGPSADVYALGATLFAMLIGRPPFQGASNVELFRKIVECDPVSPRQLNDSIPRDLETICLKCLEKRPERRYASAEELAAELGRFLEGRAIQARPLNVIGKLSRQARRRPTIAALTAAVCVLLLTLGLTGLFSFREQSRLRAIAEQRLQIALEHEANAQENADRAWQLVRTMAGGLQAASRTFESLDHSSPPMSPEQLALRIGEVAAVYDDYFRDRPVATPWDEGEVHLLATLALLRDHLGEHEHAERLRQQCLSVGTPLLEAAPKNIEFRRLLADTATLLADRRMASRTPQVSLADFEQAYRIAAGIEPEDIEHVEQFYTRSMATTNLARAYHQLGQFTEAAEIQAEGADFARSVLRIRPDDQVVEAQLIEHLCGLATERNDLDQPQHAAQLLDEVEARLKNLSTLRQTYPARDLSTLQSWMMQERARLANQL